MIVSTHSFTLILFISVAALDVASVAAMPLPFQQSTIHQAPPRITYVKQNEHKPSPHPARVMIKMRPQQAAAFRGSQLASRQIAELSRNQYTTSTYRQQEKKQPLLYVSYGSESPSSSAGWMLAGDLPISRESFISADASQDTNVDHDVNPSLQPKSSTPSSAELTAATPQESNTFYNNEDKNPDTKTLHATTSVSHQYVADGKGSAAFPIAPSIAAVNIKSPHEQDVLSRVTVINKAVSRAKANEIYDRLSTEGIDIEDPRRHSRAVLAKSKLMRQSRKKVSRLQSGSVTN
jgi:hypothetical protein